ncbi:hypothetical protein ACVW1A_003658 [Bradyrhizobium sp. LB1.3]|jgi:hypothetical protein
MRPNAPITLPRGPDTETARLFSLAAWFKKDFLTPYFEAVGNGCGWSDSEFR